MKKPDLDEAAMEFVREHKFSMPLQDVKAAMEIGAKLMADEVLKDLRKLNSDMARAKAT